MTEIDEFSDIPGMPAAEDIRAELVRTGGPRHWTPHGGPGGKAADLSGLSEEEAARVLEARLLMGPGPHGNHYQKALWQHHHELTELDREAAALTEQLAEVRGFDPATGDPIPQHSPERMRAMRHRLEIIEADKERRNGEPGMAALERELQIAVRKEQEGHRQAYIFAEAQRRANSAKTEADIERLAAGFRKASGAVQ